MDLALAAHLNGLTQQFYAAQTASFSETRDDVWPGQRRIIGMLAERAAAKAERAAAKAAGTAEQVARSTTYRVLDIGCGNLRFQRAVLDAGPELPWELHGVDSCAGFASAKDGLSIDVQPLDIVRELLDGNLHEALRAPQTDACVAFGVMHHVPTETARKRLLEAMAAHTLPGGVVVASFWRFMDDPGLADKSRAAHERALARTGIDAAALDDGDYLLGWQESDAVRYCHSFTHEEVDALVTAFADSTGSRIVRTDLFDADGRSGDLNTYLVAHIAE